MNRRERKEMARDIEQRLNDELDFDLAYEITDYHEQGTSIIDVDIDIEDCEDWPENWDELVEDVIGGAFSSWSGWYSWNGWCISVSIPD